MITDLRTQNRRIEINLSMSGYKINLDEIVDEIINDLKKVDEKNGGIGELKIDIVLK